MSERDGGRGVMCYACGVENDAGLHMEFRDEDGRVVCDYAPVPYQQGYPGRMHGGLVVTMMDEAMGWAVYHARLWAATARLNVRFRRPVPLDARLHVEAWIVGVRGRLIELRSTVHDGRGSLLAESDGTFMQLDERMAAEMSGLARDAGRGDAPVV